jgi:subtilisin-like proprotein convertase family protein
MHDVAMGRKDGPRLQLKDDPSLVAVRTRSRQSLLRGPVPRPEAAMLDAMDLIAEFPEAGVEVYRERAGASPPAMEVRKALKAAPEVRFAGRVLVEATSGAPVLYTENLFVKFVDTAERASCLVALRGERLAVKSEPSYATNAFFCEAPEGTGREIFAIAERLLARADVEACHPELVTARMKRAVFDQQWHLKKTIVAGSPIDQHANVEAALALSTGAAVTIAILDDGIDIGHPELGLPGKIVAPRDFRATPMDDDPSPGPDDDHGTACAGVACAAGVLGASGVAPGARLMPIRMPAGLGSQREAEAFVWAADHGADIISCSWGPPDGRWFDPADPRHNAAWPMPESTRLAVEHAATRGRGGKGCLIFFAAGNGNESVDLDGYASHPKVLAVAACNDRGRRSAYSDFGAAVFCAFPSNDFGWPAQNHPDPLTPGIWTTDRRGRFGYNPGLATEGDAEGNFTNSFGGTSSACPGAAGVAALVLSRAPELGTDEVKDVLKRACRPIDPAGGAWDARGHSRFYGWGRLDALEAVTLARPADAPSTLTIARTFAEPITDLRTSRVAIDVTEAVTIARLEVAVDIEHTWIGDLVVTLRPPAGSGGSPIVLHDRAGGATRNLRRTWDPGTLPALADLAGRPARGRWTLTVRDAAREDVGTIRGLTLALSLAPAVPAAPRRAKPRRLRPVRAA